MTAEIHGIEDKRTMSDGRPIPVLGMGVYKITPEDMPAAVAAAVEASYRLFDTAQLYHNEQELGEALRATPLPREETFITTKIAMENQGYDGVLQSAQDSITRMGVHYLDLLLVHWPLKSKVEETWRGMEEAKRQGLCRSIGVCNFLPEHLDRLLQSATEPPVLNQVEIHPSLTQEDQVAAHEKWGILTQSWSPLGRAQDLQNPTILSIAEAHQKTAAQVVLRWHLQRGLLIIPKSAHGARVRENANLYDFSLLETEMAAISALDAGNRVGPDPAAVYEKEGF